MRRRVWFHRGRAIAWIIAGVVAWLLGWSELVAAVWIASVYANVMSDWAASEAADDRGVLDRLDRIEALLRAAQNGPQTAGTD